MSSQAQIDRHLRDTRKLIDAIAQAGDASHALRAAVCEVNRRLQDGEGELPWQQLGVEILPTIEQAIRSPAIHGVSLVERAALRWLISRVPISVKHMLQH